MIGLFLFLVRNLHFFSNLIFQVYQEFQIQLTELTVDNLLEQFTLAKHTGLEKPGRWELFSYQNSLKHSPLKKAANQSASEGPKTPQKLLIQTSSVSPTTSSQGNTQTIFWKCIHPVCTREVSVKSNTQL